MTNSRVITIILLTGIMLGCTNTKKDKPDSSAKAIREIDMIRLTDLNGQSVSLNQYEGKTIFINFWATWCKPCIQEMPTIEEAQNILQDEKIIFLMATEESAEQINQFQNTHDYKFNYVRIENSEEINVQAYLLPLYLIAGGKLVFSETGYRDWSEKNNIDLIIKIANENE